MKLPKNFGKMKGDTKIQELERRIAQLESERVVTIIQQPYIQPAQVNMGNYQCPWCKQFYNPNTVHTCNGMYPLSSN